MLRDDLTEAVRGRTQVLDPASPDEGLTAEALAAEFSVRRNTVSHYLNQEVAAGRLLKVNTRPVYFLHRAAFEERFFPVEQAVLAGWEALWRQSGRRPGDAPGGGRTGAEPEDVFCELIGHDGSLRQALAQIKASVLYPDNSLPIMLQGPTGVGKSHIAGLVFRYAVEHGVLAADAPFVGFNCAQYANNPELLSSHLFGHVKGSFTGAHTTTNGLLGEADGGILFLDEVHRLSWEGQEKLFTFMDQGIYRRIGESGGWQRSDVRLIMATTEQLADNFLETFLRRIPVCVYIPSLEERGQDEKRLLFALNFGAECRVIDRRMRVSGRVQDLLLSHVYSGNLGELKNVVKYATATAFARCRAADEVEVGVQDLPESIIGGGGPDAAGDAAPELVLEPDAPLHLPPAACAHKPEAEPLVDRLLTRLAADGWDERFVRDAGRECRRFLNRLLYDFKPDNEAMMRFVARETEDIFRNLESSSGLRLNKADLRAVSLYLYCRKTGRERFGAGLDQHADAVERLRRHCDREFAAARLVLRQAESMLELPRCAEDELFLALFLRAAGSRPAGCQVRALILARGYATASSMADVANQTLDASLFEAIDLPVGEDRAAERLGQYLAETDSSQGLLLLTDDISDDFSRLDRTHLTGPLVLLGNASTRLATRVGELLLQTAPPPALEELAEKALAQSQAEFRIVYPRTSRQRAILTCCTAGMGTAIRLQKILDDSLPPELGIRVIASDYHHLKKRRKGDPSFQLYHVVGIVGTMDPVIAGVPFIGVDVLMAGDTLHQLGALFELPGDSELLQQINTRIVHNFSLPQLITNLTILDPEKVLRNIEQCIEQLEQLTHVQMSNARKISLHLHMSCLVERLIRNAPIGTYRELEEFGRLHRQELELIHRSLSDLEAIYSIEIPLSEQAYIYDIIYQEP